MEHFKTEAIVFQSKPFSEYDKRVIFLTKDFGKCVAIAPSAQRSLKRFGSALDSLTWVSIVCVEKNNSSLARLKETYIVHFFPLLKKDIKKIAYGSYFLEIISEVMREKEHSEWLFQFLVSFLKALEKTKNEELLARLFEARLLPQIGYEPVLDKCVKCKKSLSEIKEISFSFLEGGIKCCHPSLCEGSQASISEMARQKDLRSSNFFEPRPRARALGMTIRRESILYLQKMIHNPKTISVDLPLIQELKTILPQFLFHHIGKEPKSYKFIEML